MKSTGTITFFNKINGYLQFLQADAGQAPLDPLVAALRFLFFVSLLLPDATANGATKGGVRMR